MVNKYRRCVDGPAARAGAEGIDGMTGYGLSITRGDVMAH